MDHLARDHCEAHILPTLWTTLASSHPNIPISDMFVRVDYKLYPPTFTLMLISSYEWINPEEIVTREAALERARDQEGEWLLFRAEYMMAHSVRSSMALVSLTQRYVHYAISY